MRVSRDCATSSPETVESRFGTSDCNSSDQGRVAQVSVGPWGRDTSGNFQMGVLAVPLDHALGEVVFLTRPAGTWSVTSELTIDYMTAAPTAPTTLTVASRLTHLEGSGGYAQAMVTDGDGAVVAVGTTWVRFIPRGRVHPIFPPVAGADAGAGAVTGAHLSADDIEEMLTLSGVDSSEQSSVVLGKINDWTNLGGTLHGGIWSCLSEIAAQRALRFRGVSLTTTKVHTSYLRPAVAGTASVTARIKHLGRTFAVIEVIGECGSGKHCTMSEVTARMKESEL